MKCPHCGLIVTDQAPRCPGCDFTIADLERRMPSPPQRSGFVNDLARLLPADEKDRLEARLAQFQQRCGGEIVVVTVPTTKPLKPAEYVFWLFNRWSIGGATHAGLMILLAQQEQRIECEVGYSWETIVSDVESGEVLDAHVVPLLKEQQVAAALWQGVEQLAHILENAHSTSAGGTTGITGEPQ